MTPLEMVTEFHVAMGQPTDQKLKFNNALHRLRLNLMQEEWDEVFCAGSEEDILKELADMLYVTYGYAATYGWDLDEAFKRVHESNMSKLDDDGKPIYREDGKVTKGPNYKAPKLEDLV
jgi:predicted HAD superfamily Cof-like phosphohydrolase